MEKERERDRKSEGGWQAEKRRGRERERDIRENFINESLGKMGRVKSNFVNFST